jgi:hypothetical protein
MRNDHAFHGLAGDPNPTPEDIDRAIARARRMRSEVIHGYLARLAAWRRGVLRRAAAPKEPVGQCC